LPELHCISENHQKMQRLHTITLCAIHEQIKQDKPDHLCKQGSACKEMYQDTSITKIYTLLKVNIPPVHSIHISPSYYSVVVVVVVVVVVAAVIIIIIIIMTIMIIIIIIILRVNRCVFYINYRKMT